MCELNFELALVKCDFFNLIVDYYSNYNLFFVNIQPHRGIENEMQRAVKW